jgi:hypothetical protein
VHICYVDESGSAEVLCPSVPGSPPVYVIGGLMVPHGQLMNLVWDFLQLKKRYNPSLATSVTKLSDVIETEVKGSDLRTDLRSGRHRRERRALTLLDDILATVESHHCRLVARCMVKDTDVALDDRVLYGQAISWICRTFHHYLDTIDGEGLILLDSRTKVKNTPNTHVITTQKFKTGGDPFPKLAEVPLFGHSDSHVVLQIVDIPA